MTRNKKLMLNTVTGIIKQLVVVACGFVLPRFMLRYFGSPVNGLVSSISHFLGFISLMELGIGAVIPANLYKPLAQKDAAGVSRVVLASERFFRRIALVFLAYIALLLLVFPRLISAEFDPLFTGSLLIIISVSIFAQYYFGVTYQLLLIADQRAYVPTVIQTVTVLLNAGLCILLMWLGASVHVVKLLSSAIFVLQPLGMGLYVRRHYAIDRTVSLGGEPIRQKWNGFSQHIAYVVGENIATVVLTLFSTLSSISVYSVYFAVTNGVAQVVTTGSIGLEALFGSMLANDERERLRETFGVVEWAMHTAVAVLFSVVGVMIIPFVRLYTKGITDAEYILPLFGVVMALAYAVTCLRLPYFKLVKAAGHFKETQNGAFIAAALNVAVSAALVFPLGLTGVALGTLCSMAYHTCYFVHYLRRNILERPAAPFIGYCLTDALIAGVTGAITWPMAAADGGVGAWVLKAAMVTLIAAAVAMAVNLVFHRETTVRVARRAVEALRRR